MWLSPAYQVATQRELNPKYIWNWCWEAAGKRNQLLSEIVITTKAGVWEKKCIISIKQG